MRGEWPRRERLVVVGNGMAGMRTIEELLAGAPDRYDITIFGAEPQPGYNRILLSSALAGDRRVEDTITHSRHWHEARGIALFAGDPIVAVDRDTKTVWSAAGTCVVYDKLLLATGSKPVALPVAGLDLPGVCAFRDIADTEKMIAAAARHRRAVVIGGGLLGLEA